jgi:hypothetical protein
MTQADTRDSTQRINTPQISKEQAKQLARQERRTAAALKRLAVLRKKAQAEIDRLLSFLDASDVYVTTELEADGSDLEDGADDEPSLGSLDRAKDQTKWGRPQFVLREELDCELDDADDEPSLASPENHPSSGSGGNQQRWAAGNADDREQVSEDEGSVDADLEPSLGWTEEHQSMGGGQDQWRADFELADSTVTDKARQRFKNSKSERGGIRWSTI